MATESPLIHDGSQCTSFANYYNPTVALLGVNGSGQFLAVSLQAARVVQIATGPTAGPIYGILQNTPMAGDVADVGIMGISKAVAGAAITFGQELMVGTGGTLGQLVPWASGAANFKVGMAIEAASAQGVVFTMMIYTPNYKVVT
jgi:hypothetical protein